MATHGWKDLLNFMWQPQRDAGRHDRAPGETFDTCRGVTEMLRAEAERRGIAPAGVALQNLTDGQLEAILRWECWLPVYGDALCNAGACGTAFMLGNMAAMAGGGRAVQLLQRRLYIAADGIMGPQTYGAVIRSIGAGWDVVGMLAVADDTYFAQCRQANLFLHGWETRIADAVATVHAWGAEGR